MRIVFERARVQVPHDASVVSTKPVLPAHQLELCGHVVHDPEAGPGFYTRPERNGFLRRMEDAGGELMEEFLDRVRRENPDLNALRNLETLLVVGLPTTRILEVAEKTGAHMIVMGSQGRTGLSRFLLGAEGHAGQVA